VADVIALPEVKAVTLTGSTGAGKAVAGAAGAALKDRMELARQRPYLVLEDADLEAAARPRRLRLINSGQSCIAAALPGGGAGARALRGAVRAAHEGAAHGRPAGGGRAGQARRDLRDGVHQQVLEERWAQARVLLGGSLPDGPARVLPAHRPHARAQGHARLTRRCSARWRR
jgi:succinate-semialdehyde dehydrogenase/glutarate-semialdehyde dehydrogenase